MPRRPKIDRLPAQIRDWLRAELQARGYADYDDVTEALNARLVAGGLNMTVGRSAVHNYGQAQQRFTAIQREADAWAQSFLGQEGVEKEAHRHRVLFSMLSNHAFRVMKNGMAEGDEKEDLDFDARDLHFLGRMLKDLMASSGLREAISDKALEREISKERKAAAGRAESVSRSAGLSPDVSAAIRAAVEGGGT